MQQFTRALTREIQVAGERLAVTFDKDGMSIRAVGSRRPPLVFSWQTIFIGCAQYAGGEDAPHPEHVPDPQILANAIKILKAGGERTSRPAKAEKGATPSAPAEAPPASPPATNSKAEGLAGLLSRLDHWLQAHRPHFYKGLLPGATPEQLSALESALGKPLSQDLHAWLSWHNGQNPEVVGALEENWHPMSSTEIAEAKITLDAERHEGWQNNWVPCLDDDADSYLCLDASTPGSPVYACWSGKSEHPVVAPSLASWVERLVTGLEQGAYTEDPERGAMYHT
jgi:cell wall assembly regulator SMI1